jgi:hypothetical protein
MHLAVRPNLFQCLNEFRCPTEIRTLWIGAICIDQANVQERNQQVKEMGEIYAQAKLVRIWVGNPSSWTKELFGFLNSPLEDRALFWRSFNVSGILLGDAERETPLLQALLDVCSRGYWERAWILQEVMLSGSKVLHCGPYSTPWNIFCDALNSVSHSSAGPMRSELREKPVYRLSEIPNVPVSSSSDGWRKEATLEVLLEMYGEAACASLKDRVYALLSLAKDCTSDHPFPIDYAEDELVLLFRTIIFCKPKNPFKFASRLLQILGIDRANLRQRIHSHDQEIKLRQLQVELSTFYFGTTSEISTSAPEGQGCFRWTHVKRESVLEKLAARRMFQGPPHSSSNYSNIKMYQIEGSPIAILLTSIAEGEAITFIPVVIQQVRDIDEFEKEELNLYRSSETLYNASIKGGNSLFCIVVSLEPESFLWLLVESEKWVHIQQPWAEGRQRERQEYGEEAIYF